VLASRVIHFFNRHAHLCTQVRCTPPRNSGGTHTAAHSGGLLALVMFQVEVEGHSGEEHPSAEEVTGLTGLAEEEKRQDHSGELACTRHHRTRERVRKPNHGEHTDLTDVARGE
jgi:hypothetical protein